MTYLLWALAQTFRIGSVDVIVTCAFAYLAFFYYGRGHPFGYMIVFFSIPCIVSCRNKVFLIFTIPECFAKTTLIINLRSLDREGDGTFTILERNHGLVIQVANLRKRSELLTMPDFSSQFCHYVVSA